MSGRVGVWKSFTSCLRQADFSPGPQRAGRASAWTQLLSLSLSLFYLLPASLFLKDLRLRTFAHRPLPINTFNPKANKHARLARSPTAAGIRLRWIQKVLCSRQMWPNHTPDFVISKYGFNTTVSYLQCPLSDGKFQRTKKMIGEFFMAAKSWSKILMFESGSVKK